MEEEILKSVRIETWCYPHEAAVLTNPYRAIGYSTKARAERLNGLAAFAVFDYMRRIERLGFRPYGRGARMMPNRGLQVVPLATAIAIPKDVCPRCYLQRRQERVLEMSFAEHLHVFTCNHCGYEVKETNASLRLAFMNAQRYHYLDPKRGRIRILRTR
jgi:hypothetical protein